MKEDLNVANKTTLLDYLNKRIKLWTNFFESEDKVNSLKKSKEDISKKIKEKEKYLNDLAVKEVDEFQSKKEYKKQKRRYNDFNWIKIIIISLIIAPILIIIFSTRINSLVEPQIRTYEQKMAFRNEHETLLDIYDTLEIPYACVFYFFLLVQIIISIVLYKTDHIEGFIKFLIASIIFDLIFLFDQQWRTNLIITLIAILSSFLLISCITLIIRTVKFLKNEIKNNGKYEQEKKEYLLKRESLEKYYQQEFEDKKIRIKEEIEQMNKAIPNIDKELEETEKDKDKAEEELNKQYNDSMHKNYQNYNKLIIFVDYLEKGRCDSLKECINLYEQEKSMEQFNSNVEDLQKSVENHKNKVNQELNTIKHENAEMAEVMGNLGSQLYEVSLKQDAKEMMEEDRRERIRWR